MKKEELNREAVEITRQLIRDGKVTGPADVLDYVPEVLSSVIIDRPYIKKCIERELNRSTANPINAILKLVGLRIVRTQSEVDNLSAQFGDGLSLKQSGRGDLDSFLRLDREALTAALTKMASALSNAENERRGEQEAADARYKLAHGELTRTADQLNQLTADFDDMRRTVAERAQYMLSLTGPDGSGTPVIDQLYELLDDLDMSVYWDAAGAPFTESAMFSTLKVMDLAGRKARPCIVCGGTILAKGLRFTAEPAGETEELSST